MMGRNEQEKDNVRQSTWSGVLMQRSQIILNKEVKRNELGKEAISFHDHIHLLALIKDQNYI